MRQKGQILLITVFVLLIALGISVAIASRYMKRVRNVVQVDNSSRAVAVAEAGVEKLLKEDLQTLISYAQGTNCGSNCLLELVGPDNLIANAVINITEMGSSYDPFVYKGVVGSVQEINLSTYPGSSSVSVCWNGNEMSLYASYIYGTVGSYQMDIFAYNPRNSENTGNNFSTAIAANSYDNCFSVPTKTNSIALRVRPIYSGGNIAIISANGVSLPSQGVIIDSTGYFKDAVRSVRVRVNYPTLPASFDYSLYQTSGTDVLTN